jgi:hypothetical protein
MIPLYTLTPPNLFNTLYCTIQVWRTLRLLPADEIESIVTMNQRVEMKCEFCGEAYGIEAKDIEQALMVPE